MVHHFFYSTCLTPLIASKKLDDEGICNTKSWTVGAPNHFQTHSTSLYSMEWLTLKGWNCPFQEISNGRTRCFRTPQKTWVSNSSIAPYLGVRWDSVPFTFWWIHIFPGILIFPHVETTWFCPRTCSRHWSGGPGAESAENGNGWKWKRQLKQTPKNT